MILFCSHKRYLWARTQLDGADLSLNHDNKFILMFIFRCLVCKIYYSPLKNPLTVQRSFWYWIRKRMTFAVPAAITNSLCSMVFEPNPWNVKRFGAITIATFFNVILFLSRWSITLWRNSSSTWNNSRTYSSTPHMKKLQLKHDITYFWKKLFIPNKTTLKAINNRNCGYVCSQDCSPSFVSFK